MSDDPPEWQPMKSKTLLNDNAFNALQKRLKKPARTINRLKNLLAKKPLWVKSVDDNSNPPERNNP